MPPIITPKVIKRVVKNAFTILVLCIFSLIIVQPDKFVVAYKPTNDNVYASYSELLQIADQPADGAIHFETHVVGGDQDPQLVYIVRHGDTLSDIAKTFGTTVDAIMETNGITNPNQLNAGKRIAITYKEGVIYEVTEQISLEQFAKKYELNLQDLLTLNYIDDADAPLQAGQQIFLDLNRLEAESKGLIEKREFQALNLIDASAPTEGEDPAGELFADNIGDDELQMERAPREAGEQEVITAEQTDEHLQNLEKQQEQAKIAREEAQKAAEREAQRREQELAAQREAAAAAKANAERIAQQEAQKQQEAGITCGENQCLHDGRCWTRPENAYCAPTDPVNAWICKEGYTDTGKDCVIQQAEKPAATQPATSTAPRRSGSIVKQRYFNPYNEGYSNGRGGGHCTHYVGWYWWKHYGIMTNWRGNARAWYKNASSAGWAVGQTPEVGSIVVLKNGAGGWSSYGHVGIVIDIDRDSGEILIEDMNYVGRYIASQHWIPMNSTSNPIIGYIYPRS